jgi:hypothetical protein
MKKRIKLFEFTELIQATLLKCLSEKENDCIKVTVYGYSKTLDHIEFSYEIEFKNELDRDLTFDEITSELIFEDVKKIISSSRIPILI